MVLFRVIALMWVMASPVLAVLVVGVLFLLHVFRLAGTEVQVSLFLFVAGFTLTGAIDGLWRYFVAWHANNLYRQADKQLDDHTRRLIRISRVNGWTVVLQIVIGIGAGLGWIPLWL